MTDQERFSSLTPRERDVYEVWREHPDWPNALIARTVYLPPHVVRRYKQNIQRKLGLPDPPPAQV